MSEKGEEITAEKGREIAFAKKKKRRDFLPQKNGGGGSIVKRGKKNSHTNIHFPWGGPYPLLQREKKRGPTFLRVLKINSGLEGKETYRGGGKDSSRLVVEGEVWPNGKGEGDVTILGEKKKRKKKVGPMSLEWGGFPAAKKRRGLLPFIPEIEKRGGFLAPAQKNGPKPKLKAPWGRGKGGKEERKRELTSPHPAERGEAQTTKNGRSKLLLRPVWEAARQMEGGGKERKCSNFQTGKKKAAILLEKKRGEFFKRLRKKRKKTPACPQREN